MTPRLQMHAAAALWLAFIASAIVVHAHSGPPFPLVSDRHTGPYVISIWADPDSTDDGTAAGQFWVYVDAAAKTQIPAGTRVTVTATALDRVAPARSKAAEPVRADVTRQFAAVVLDHEGPFAVHVAIAGPLGSSTVDATVDATYDLRPSKAMVFVYLVPFLLVGGLWTMLLFRRRRKIA